MSLEPAMPPPGLSRTQRQLIAEVLARYGLAPGGEPAPVAASVLNQNYRVPTTGGVRFVRFHRKTRTRERLELEQDVIRKVAGAGIPAFPALADGEGRWLHSLSNQFISVHQWLDGANPRPGAITPRDARLLGDLHGRIHAALRDFADPRLPVGGTGSAWDVGDALEMLGRVDDLIRYYPAQSPEQLQLQAGIRDQMRMLESGAARPASDFSGLRRQCCHGDYHGRNVIFDGNGGVLAVADWELAGMLPPIFEVIRALSFMELWEPALCGAYLGAYRDHAQLEDCETGVEMWWQAQLHDAWAYRARFIEGNRAAGQFIEPHRRLLAQLAEPAYRESLVRMLKNT